MTKIENSYLYDPSQSLKNFIDDLIDAVAPGQGTRRDELLAAGRRHLTELVQTIQPTWFADGIATTVLYDANGNRLHQTLVQLEKRDRRRIVSVERLSPFTPHFWADWLIVHYPLEVSTFSETEILETVEEMQHPPYHNVMPGLVPFLIRLGISEEKVSRFQR